MEEVTSYWVTRLLIQRGLALIYLIAFLVALNQFRPLLGEQGLLPVPLFLQRVRFGEAPSLFWLWPKDIAFALAAWTGLILALLALFGIPEKIGTPASMLTWALLWVLYLSFVNVGQRFYAFGWESILLETGFLAIFLGGAKTEPSVITVWLLRWVLFRIMFGAGLIKLRGDPCWTDLTCMHYHYETQPIPGPLSSFFHFLPPSFHKAEVLINHIVELGVPFLFFAPQPFAGIAGIITIAFQGWLILSGNLAFLNWITVVLAFSTFSDAFLLKFLPVVSSVEPPLLTPRGTIYDYVLVGLAMLVAILSINPIQNMLSPGQVMNATFDSLHLVNTYGAFGSVTKERLEVVVEGTRDAAITPETRWQEYEFKGKPGNPARSPPQIAPYHLRLDWLMWFLPFRLYSKNPPLVAGHETWFINFLAKLLKGDEATLKLLHKNPFPDSPPHLVRALLYRYKMATTAEQKQSGSFWKRELLGTYFPEVSLENPSFRQVLREQGWE